MLTQIKKLSVSVVFLFIASVSHADGYCQLKDLEHNVILQMYNAYTVNEACSYAQQDCYSQTNSCLGWNSGQVTN